LDRKGVREGLGSLIPYGIPIIIRLTGNVSGSGFVQYVTLAQFSVSGCPKTPCQILCYADKEMWIAQDFSDSKRMFGTEKASKTQ
jgi:hypothetical protein